MPLFKVVVRAVECREYFIDAESAPAAFEEISAAVSEGVEACKCYWDTEEIDDPVECCVHCKQELDSMWSIACCQSRVDDLRALKAVGLNES